MAKKRVRDFNKVKLKLGRTLKRQKETVVDLSRKKILLPKERTHIDVFSCVSMIMFIGSMVSSENPISSFMSI